MSSDVAIQGEKLSKCYRIYDKPRDRLLQMLTRGRRRYYREFWALKEVSFDIRQGETVGIIGRNGSGKSTLLQLMCGTLHPTSGSIHRNGRIAALLELGTGFNPEFTGRENISLSCALLGLDTNEVAARMNSIISFADIGTFIDQPVRTYSTGMFVRLAFSIQANVDPEILIVDEALAVGDAHFVHKCMLRFHELQKRGTTIIVVSHDSSAIKRLCHRALWLKNGCLHMAGGATEVVDAYLNHLFDLVEQEAPAPAAAQAHSQVAPEDDLTVPNGHDRHGTKELEIVNLRLTDSDGTPTSMVDWDQVIQLSMTIRNNSLEPGMPCGCGYILRDSKGIEIASSSTWFDNIALMAPARNGVLRVLVEIKIPMLHPGSYALTPSVSSQLNAHGPKIQDRIVNAFVFEVTTQHPIVTPMRLETRFSVEVEADSPPTHMGAA